VTSDYGLEDRTTPAVVTVSCDAITAIVVLPDTASLAAGTTLAFEARAVYPDSTTVDVTDLAEWASSDPDVATVDGLGVATGVSPGETTISATWSGLTGTALLTVTE
jgi:uncharacterized protein YjdB